MSGDRINFLLARLFEGIITLEEKEELALYIRQINDEALEIEIKKKWNNYQSAHFIEEEKAQMMLSQIFIGSGEQENKGPIFAIVKPLWRFAAAAMLILILGSGAYVYFSQLNNNTNQIASGKNVGNDVLPGGDKAVLILSDGKKIYLDSTTGKIAQEDGITLINLQGELSYKINDDQAAGNIQYHTITTPRGGQYQLVLSDGSRVWLNAASSLRFPTAFTNSERMVELTGEGYFEIETNPSKPFKIKTGLQFVEVLGTHFNINNYKEEDKILTTLLEGSVKISTLQGQSMRLQPGQQAEVDKNHSSVRLNKNIDVDQVMAWKNGWFEFDYVTLPTIMRQLSRWYDIDVTYTSKPGDEKFGGRISRNMPLSKVLQMLETNGVQFKIESKKLIVKP